MTQITKHRPSTPRQASKRTWPLDKALNPGLFKALSDPTRVRLFSCLAKCGRMCSVTEVAECCSVDFSVVSRHLAMLAEAGLLAAHKQGRTMFYHVQFEHVCESLRAVAGALENCCPEGSCTSCDCDGNC